MSSEYAFKSQALNGHRKQTQKDMSASQINIPGQYFPLFAQL